MIYINRHVYDPYFNIAAEEFILKNINDEILMFWENEPCVIIGKHQNTLKEVNTEFTEKNNIPVIRRISGGGTVFHDRGNINYTLITEPESKTNLVDFHKFTQPVIDFFKTFGLDVQFKGKNNLTLYGKKFSGNSGHVFKNRVLHHGTLLFQTNLDWLNNVINKNSQNIKDKSIPSIRAQVTNISDYLPMVTKEVFMKKMLTFFISYFNIKETRQLSANEIYEINSLAKEKYHTWKWNYGYSPVFSFENNLNTVYGNFETKLTIKDGIIKDVVLYFEGKRLAEIEKKIINQQHQRELLNKKLAANRFYEILVKTLFPL